MRGAPALKTRIRQTKIGEQPDAPWLEGASDAGDKLAQLVGRKTIEKEMSSHRIILLKPKRKNIGVHERDSRVLRNLTASLLQHSGAAVHARNFCGGTGADDLIEEAARPFAEKQNFSAVRDCRQMLGAA